MGMALSQFPRLALPLVLAVALPVLAQPQDASSFPPQGLQLQLEQAFVQGAAINVPKEPAVRIRFDADGSVSGQGPINLYRGHVQWNGDGSFAWQGPGLFTTRRAGPQELMEFESNYLRALEGTSHLEFTGSTLTLSSETGEIRLVYSTVAPKQAIAPWLGRPLVLKEFRSAGKAVSLPTQPKLEITLAADGACAGFSGVNRFSGTCTISETGQFHAGLLASTMMAGPPELAALESAFQMALAAITKIQASDGALRFTDESGQTSLTWEPR